MTSANEDLLNLKKQADAKAPQLKHGRITKPKSRAQFLNDEGRLDDGQVNELEGGKLFPATVGGLTDPDATTDVANRAPPADGLIASGGHTADARNLLNEPGSHWKKHSVSSGETLDITWTIPAQHKTRRWTYWITKVGWNHNEPLARAHFEPVPLHTVLNPYVPYYGPDADKELVPDDPTNHQLTLPSRQGYHVLLAVWDVADTPAAFYQVIDLNFK